MTYEEARKEAKGSLRTCSDQSAMAAFCEGPLQQIVGAVSPRLVWEGAMRRGLSYKDLAVMCVRDPLAVGELVQAYKSGTLHPLESRLTLDNDITHVYAAGECVFCMHPDEVLEQALDLLGVPHEPA